MIKSLTNQVGFPYILICKCAHCIRELTGGRDEDIEVYDVYG